MNRILDWVIESKNIIIVSSIAFVLALSLNAVFNISLVSGESMYPTYHSGDITIINKMEKPTNGDIITFYKDIKGKRELLIKRVCGVPGDVILISKGVLYRNGSKIDESYLDKGIDTTLDTEAIKLGDDEYWVMGDNRYFSYDSRKFGPIKEGDIQGVVKKSFTSRRR